MLNDCSLIPLYGSGILAVISMINVGVQIYAMNRGTKAQAAAARLSGAATYIANISDAAGAGGSSADQALAYKAKRALLRQVGEDLRGIGIAFPDDVPKDWPNY